MLAAQWSSSSHAFGPTPTGATTSWRCWRRSRRRLAALDGCLHYGYYTEITDPLSFVAVEEWRDNDALAAHLRQPHVARLIAALPDLGDGRLEIAAHEVAVQRAAAAAAGRPPASVGGFPASRQKASSPIVELVRDLLKGW